jgi:hypothetical protein
MYRVEELERYCQNGVRTCFKFCPLCGAEGSIECQINRGPGRRPDYIICSNCLAKWHVWIGKSAYNFGKLSWAELITDGNDKKGTELLGRRESPEFWQDMGFKRRKELPKTEGQNAAVTVREKEIIREIVKVRCRHCGTLYLETLDKCPNCGASL